MDDRARPVSLVGDNVKRRVPWKQRTKWPGKSSLMETQVTHLMFVHLDRKVISVDEPLKRNTQKESSKPRHARIVKRADATDMGP